MPLQNSPLSKTRQAKKSLPKNLRRLTKAEAEKLGIKHSSKHYVNADLKRITKKTKTFSQRQAVNAQLGTTKEKYTATRLKHEERSDRYMSPKERDIKRMIGRARGKRTMVSMFGTPNDIRFSYAQGENHWVSTAYMDGDELGEFLRRLDTEDGIYGFSASNPPLRLDIRIERVGRG
jgi:DNA-binding CsgD family transcriptional regulator